MKTNEATTSKRRTRGIKVLVGHGRRVHLASGRGSWTWGSVTLCGKAWFDEAPTEAPVNCQACMKAR